MDKLNVLIIGNSPANGSLAEGLQNAGFAAETLTDSGAITRVRRCGETYAVRTDEKEYTASAVIITEPPDSNLANPEKIKGPAKVVFLLDHASETPEYLTTTALVSAISMKKAKKEVFFLSRFVKAASDGLEELYLEARRTGITFIKYETAEIDFDEEKNSYTIKAFDGLFETIIETPHLVSAEEPDLTALTALAKKLRLTADDTFFLHPGMTTRRGVFYLGSAIINGRDPAESLSKILPSIIAEIKACHTNRHLGSYAVIDAEKCAFCYTCYRVCAHAALEPDSEAAAMACVKSACMGCGACAAICPGEAIVMEGEPDKTEGTSPSGCKVFCCENSAGPALQELVKELGETAANLSITEMPCGGRLGQEAITGALVAYEKVLVAVCIDDACRHMDGGKRACRQTERTIALLEKSGLSAGRIKCVKISHAMPGVLKDSLASFLAD